MTPWCSGSRSKHSAPYASATTRCGPTRACTGLTYTRCCDAAWGECCRGEPGGGAQGSGARTSAFELLDLVRRQAIELALLDLAFGSLGAELLEVELPPGSVVDARDVAPP